MTTVDKAKVDEAFNTLKSMMKEKLADGFEKMKEEQPDVLELLKKGVDDIVRGSDIGVDDYNELTQREQKILSGAIYSILAVMKDKPDRLVKDLMNPTISIWCYMENFQK